MSLHEDQYHDFVSHTFLKPTDCSYCNHFLFGVWKQGKICKHCGIPIHDKCQRFASGLCPKLTGQDPKAPETTKVPEPTKTPETTKTSVATKAPETTKAPEPTKTSVATKAPETTKTSEPTKTPETKTLETKTPETKTSETKTSETKTTPTLTPKVGKIVFAETETTTLETTFDTETLFEEKSGLRSEAKDLFLPEDTPRSSQESTSIVVIGASGDLAKRKTFPALFGLFALELLPQNTTFWGFSRQEMTDDQFHKTLDSFLKEFPEKKAAFLKRVKYISLGGRATYSTRDAYIKLDKELEKAESKVANRLFYLALPPTQFLPVCEGINKAPATSSSGWNRVIVEKPFGFDTESSLGLVSSIAQFWNENQTYRIDHYLGKEMVQNLMVLRFGNIVWDAIWNYRYIRNVTITFKEDIDLMGRAGYFDTFGIIRDVIQNHLTQILSLIGMEAPATFSAEDIRDEKVKVLRCCAPVKVEETVTGQYKGYTLEPDVPPTSPTPTFASCVVHINNARWQGVPFFIKAGKALNERKTEVRIQLKEVDNPLFPTAPNNELVLRVQPSEAVYMKLNAKTPGLASNLVETELDLTYHNRFEGRVPDAYERLILACHNGDSNLFVRADELDAAWKIFTPLLHAIEKGQLKPHIYEKGQRSLSQSDDLMQRFGFKFSKTYSWAADKTK